VHRASQSVVIRIGSNVMTKPVGGTRRIGAKLSINGTNGSGTTVFAIGTDTVIAGNLIST
jgi:hypothetical protein